jgi:predicted RNA polymerase sigma factor
MERRIGRAKQRIRDTGAKFEPPTQAERGGRLAVVLHVLYLLFNEGYTTTSGPALTRVDLTAEAIRLTRLLCTYSPRSRPAPSSHSAALSPSPWSTALPPA